MSSTLVIPQHVADRIHGRGEFCATCRFSRKAPDGDMECHESSPQATVILLPVQPGKAVHRPGMQALQPQPFSTWPVVMGDQWCGKWQAKRETLP